MSKCSDEVEVLAGTHGRLRWQVRATGTSGDLMTMLHVFDGDVLVSSSGFGCPPPYAGDRVNKWQGRTDDVPYFVMTRAAVEVCRLVTVTDRGRHVELLLGGVNARFGPRLPAAGLPDGEGPRSLLVEVEGGPEKTIPQSMRACSVDSRSAPRGRPSAEAPKRLTEPKAPLATQMNTHSAY